MSMYLWKRIEFEYVGNQMLRELAANDSGGAMMRDLISLISTLTNGYADALTHWPTVPIDHYEEG
jgi:hypothetical protein